MTNKLLTCEMLRRFDINYSIEYLGEMTVIDTEKYRFFFTEDGNYYGTITKLPFEA